MEINSNIRTEIIKSGHYVGGGTYVTPAFDTGGYISGMYGLMAHISGGNNILISKIEESDDGSSNWSEIKQDDVRLSGDGTPVNMNFVTEEYTTGLKYKTNGIFDNKRFLRFTLILDSSTPSTDNAYQLFWQGEVSIKPKD